MEHPNLTSKHIHEAQELTQRHLKERAEFEERYNALFARSTNDEKIQEQYKIDQAALTKRHNREADGLIKIQEAEYNQLRKEQKFERILKANEATEKLEARYGRMPEHHTQNISKQHVQKEPRPEKIETASENNKQTERQEKIAALKEQWSHSKDITKERE